MFKYALKDGKLTKTQVDNGAMTLKALQERTCYSTPVVYNYNRYVSGGAYKRASKNVANSIFKDGLGTKAFVPTSHAKWDNTRKCFIWKCDKSKYEIYDASNVRLTIRGYYLSNFDVSKLPDAKNKKANKKKYALLNNYCEDALRECKRYDKKATEDQVLDYTRDDRLYEYRAWWCIRQLICRAFKEGKRISAGTLTDMFVRTSYMAKFQNTSYAFGKYVREFGEELIDYLTAETEKDGNSEGGRSESDDGRP